MSSFRSQRWRRAALLFVSLFLFAILTQILVGWYQRRTTARANLRSGVDEILRELKYSDRWDLTRFRQADLSVNGYYILDRSGLVIEISKFVPDLMLRADPTGWDPGIKTLTVPATNETWRLLVTPVYGGRVILGYSSPEDFTRVDERLRENAKYFRNSLEKAMSTDISDIDRDIDYAILDNTGRIHFAVGGIPLILLDYPRLPFSKIQEIPARRNVTYGFLSVPFTDKSGQKVGIVTVVDQLPPQPWLSLRAWLINLSASFVLAFTGTLFGVRYIRDEFRPDELLRQALQLGESSTVEFKESLRWDYWQARPDQPADLSKAGETKSIAEAVSVERVAGFLNSRTGGTLLIGVADDKTLVGLGRDYESLIKRGENRGGQDKDRDRFQLHLGHLLAAKIGHDVTNLCVQTAIVSSGEKDVCVARVVPSPTPIYVIGRKGRKAFYLRDAAETVELDVEETVAYCTERWPGRLFARILRRARRT